MSDHLSRKELKQDKVRETFEHGAEAVLSHTKLASIALVILIVAGLGYFGWKFYTDRQTGEAQSALDEAMKIYSAPLAVAGQPTPPGEITYGDPMQRAQDAETKLSAVANKYPRTKPGKLARYYAALCLMDLDKLNQASEQLSKLDASSDRELSALAQFQKALIAERTGKNDEAIKTLRALSASDSVLVPKPMVLLELAGVLRLTDPKQATTLYEQIKKDYPNSNIAEQADKELGSLSPAS